MSTGSAEYLLQFCSLVACEPTLIDNVRDKSTDIGMHSARNRKENAAFWRNGIVAGKEVLKRRRPTLSGMGALDWLRKLHGIADQHDVLGAGAHADNIRSRDLTCLIYKQVVEAHVKIVPRK